jgi:hypothetical protein
MFMGVLAILGVLGGLTRSFWGVFEENSFGGAKQTGFMLPEEATTSCESA